MKADQAQESAERALAIADNAYSEARTAIREADRARDVAEAAQVPTPTRPLTPGEVKAMLDRLKDKGTNQGP